MISRINKIASYDIEKIDAPDVSYIENENSLKYTQIKEKCTVTLSIPLSRGLTTFCAPFDIQLPQEVTAYYCARKPKSIKVNFVEYDLEDRILPAYTPAILECETVDILETYTGYRTSSDVICNNGILYGLVESVESSIIKDKFANKLVLILSANEAGEVGFYPTGSGNFSAYKAFIVIEDDIEDD